MGICLATLSTFTQYFLGGYDKSCLGMRTIGTAVTLGAQPSGAMSAQINVWAQPVSRMACTCLPSTLVYTVGFSFFPSKLALPML